MRLNRGTHHTDHKRLAQLLCLCIGVLLLACLGVYSQYNRGALWVAALIIFALTSCVNGYVAGKRQKKGEEKNIVEQKKVGEQRGTP